MVSGSGTRLKRRQQTHNATVARAAAMNSGAPGSGTGAAGLVK